MRARLMRAAGGGGNVREGVEASHSCAGGWGGRSVQRASAPCARLINAGARCAGNVRRRRGVAVVCGRSVGAPGFLEKALALGCVCYFLGQDGVELGFVGGVLCGLARHDGGDGA